MADYHFFFECNLQTTQLQETWGPVPARMNLFKTLPAFMHFFPAQV